MLFLSSFVLGMKDQGGLPFAELDWGGLLDARAEMYIVVVAEMAL